MNKRILFIILGAFLVLTFVIVLWFWLLGREPGGGAGSFGTGDARPLASSTGLGGGNTQMQIGGYPAPTTGPDGNVNTQTPIEIPGVVVYNPETGLYEEVQGGTSIPNYTPDLPIFTPGDTDIGDYTPPGVIWFDSGALKNFTPTPINQVNSFSLSGTPYITNPGGIGSTGTGGGGGIGLGGALGGAAAGLALCTTGLLGATSVVAGIDSAAWGAAELGVTGGLTVPGLPVADEGVRIQNHAFYSFSMGNDVAQTSIQANDTFRENFLDCITRGIAKIAIERITASTVDWINSGFDGKPAFIQDYKKFFTDIADRSAGEFLQGTSLAFLCSPFQLKVKIAIAQSYARNRSGGQQQCSLSKVVGNIDNFMNGDFKEGGWRGLLSVTTEPTNNPFGAYMYGQGLLRQVIAYDQQTATLKISPGGFLSKEECQTINGRRECKIVTPGQTIENALQKALDTPIDSLQLADSFDEIIGALVQQLLTRTLYGGLANVSGPNGYQSNFFNSLDTAAMGQAEQVLQNMQGAVAAAQQYGSVQQGSILDIQNAQNQLTDLENCYVSKGQQAQAASVAAQTASLEARIATYNSNITRANAAITKVQEFQTELLAARTAADVQAVSGKLSAAQSSGVLISSSLLTSAQQNRTTLQSEMSSLNNQTTARFNQCNAS